MTADILELLASLVLLTAAGDQFVLGVARMASALHVRATVVGAVVGGIGTSLPELIVAGVAAARGDSGLAVGSMVGSIVANVSLALSIAALVAPVRVDSRTVRREAPVSVGAVLLFAVLAWRRLGRTGAILSAVALGAALVILLVNASRSPAGDELAVEVVDFFDAGRRRRSRVEIVRTIASTVGMVAGAELLVRAAASLAGRLGIAQGFLGLTLVAVGTSAPLIASAIQAARRGDHDLVVGNVLGGNLFIALAGGATVGFLAGSPAGGVGVAPLVLMGAVVAVAWGFMARGSLITRWEALLLLIAYLVTIPFVAR